MSTYHWQEQNSIEDRHEAWMEQEHEARLDALVNADHE